MHRFLSRRARATGSYDKKVAIYAQCFIQKGTNKVILGKKGTNKKGCIRKSEKYAIFEKEAQFIHRVLSRRQKIRRSLDTRVQFS